MQEKVITTVVIPCYNDGEYIEETIASINAQSASGIEIIIVDDASTDLKTIETLKALKQRNLKVIFLENNGGPSVARNSAIKEAKGKYILPLDADDKIAPTYIEKAQKILNEKNEVGIVYCEAELFGDKRDKWELPPYSFPEILTGNMIFATALFRRADWKVVGGYNENMRYGNEDYDFWLSLIELGREVYQIPETLFFYRIKHSSRTTELQSNIEREIDTFEQIFNNHKELYLKNIRVFFKTIKEQQNKLNNAHMDIIALHKELENKDNEIKKLHTRLSNIQEQAGKTIEYAYSIISLRDKQIEVLNSLTIKKRLKQKIKKYIPDSMLNLFGFTPYKPITIPTEESEGITEPNYNKTNLYIYKEPKFTKIIENNLKYFRKQPKISIVMPVYNVDPKWLDLAIKSVEAQWYKNWELCIADDKSTNENTINYLKSLNNPKIKVKFLNKNLNISGATNEALLLATGDYISLMDNDDEITPDALYEMVKIINQEDADFIYSDEDFVDTKGNYSNPHFKPDWSPDLLLTHNYITHFTCFKKVLLEKVGNFNSEFDGAQDYDLFLRLTEIANKIYHIPKVLYHWRTLETSTSANSEAKPEALERGRKTVENAIKRRGIDGTVENANINHYFRVKYKIKNNPLVSIVIPFKDKPELLDMCINSILQKSTYSNFEIIGVSNNSKDKSTFALMKELEKLDPRVKFYEYNEPFNYAKINNYAVDNFAKGEHILLLNNDIEVISPNWIEAMLEHSQREKIGCVGAKLYYPDNTIQHAGIIIGLGGYAGHSHKMYKRDSCGYFNRLNAIQNVSAVTAACLMVKKSIYQEVDGMDEVKFKVAYNDVDFCLRVREKGYLNIFTPYAELYHHESISRGYETTPEKIARFQTEKDALFERHKEILTNGDPYYNPNLTQDKEDFSICLN